MTAKKLTLKFEYVNWEGKRGIREVEPIEIWYGSTKWHKKDQWLFKAKDIRKQAERDFALKDVVRFF